MPRVLVSDALSGQGLAALRSAKGFEVDYQPGLDEAALANAIKGAAGLVIRSGSQVTARVIEAADTLKVIGRAGIGVDNIDVDAASRRGIAVMNTPTGNAVTTAEHAISLMMSLARWIPLATASMKAGKWEKKKFQGRELAGKTLGIVGLGTIGRIVADRAKGLHMRVMGFDPVLSADRAAQLGVELVELEQLWAQADVITVHTPLTPQTKGLVDDETVAKLRDGVLLVNCARGGIYDEAAVLRGLDSGKIGGAAFDVYPQEPPPADAPIIAHERVVCTPHLGASTKEAQERVAVQIAEQVVAFLTRGEVSNALNVPSVSVEIAAKLAPWTTLAERLGKFVAQVEPLVADCIEIECVGEACDSTIEPIVAAALSGLLSHYLDAPVNRISAPHMASERGISVRQLKTTSARGPFASQVILRVTDREQTTHVASGALGSDGSPRLVRWGNFDIEAHLDGQALVVASLDKPGVIGFMGAALGDANINVASVFLGKAPEEGMALSVWNLDDPIGDDVLSLVSRSPNVTRALVVRY